MEQNYYEILEVNKNASPEIIEKAYKTLVKKYHPDLQQDENKNKYEEKIKKINEAKRIIVCGTGRSGLMLKSFAMRLMQIGYISYVVGETITPAIKEGDLLIVASASGETNSVCQAVKSAQKENVKVITITANEQSTLYKLQQALITIKVSTKFNTVNITKQPLGSLFEQALLIIFDAIILKIAKENENMNSVMAMRHANIE